MLQSLYLRAKEIFPGSEVVRKNSFNAMSLWAESAHFRKIVLNACHRMK